MSFLNSLFSIFSGNSANTDRGQQLEGMGDLKNVFNYSFPTGKSEFSTGQQTQGKALSDLGDPASYYHNLLTGGREGALSAVAPTVNAANASTDAQKRQLADFGTARGGGTAETGQQLDTAKMTSIDNAIAGARSGAAAGETQVAGVEGSIGSSQLQAALNMLGLSKESATSLTDQARMSRTDSQNLHNQKAQQGTDVAAGILDALFTGG